MNRGSVVQCTAPITGNLEGVTLSTGHCPPPFIKPDLTESSIANHFHIPFVNTTLFCHRLSLKWQFLVGMFLISLEVCTWDWPETVHLCNKLLLMDGLFQNSEFRKIVEQLRQEWEWEKCENQLKTMWSTTSTTSTMWSILVLALQGVGGQDQVNCLFF